VAASSESAKLNRNAGRADLVLAGGGVKGIALVGALEALEDHGYDKFQRVAGTSVGAIVGALVAAGIPARRIAADLNAFEFPKLRDKDLIDRVPLIGKPASLLFDHGIYEGDAVRDWLFDLLDEQGVRTFGDLREAAAKRNGVEVKRQPHPLVVFATDVTRGRLVRFPDDYKELYGLKPSEQLVAEAVRASMSIPLFFEPVELAGSMLVDGAVLSNYAIDAFDAGDPSDARWPTFGMTLMNFDSTPVLGRDLAGSIIPALRYAPKRITWFVEDLIGTVIAGQDRHAIERRGVAERTIQINANDYGIVDFDIDATGKLALIDAGRRAAISFLQHWDGDDGRPGSPRFAIPPQVAKAGKPKLKLADPVR
jgi:NTE family protein